MRAARTASAPRAPSRACVRAPVATPRSSAIRVSAAPTRVAVAPATPCRYFQTSPVVRSGHKAYVHRPSDKNNDATPFEFDEANTAKARVILAKYPEGYKQGALMPLLDLAQKVAKICGCTDMDAFQVATFYTMYNRDPIGQHHVQVCTTTPCMLRGGYDILEACKKHLGVQPGETTNDNKFTLTEVECLGACVNAPMMQINDDFYEDLTEETTKKVLDELAAGRKPKVGPQNGRRAAEGPMGKTTLFEEPPGPGFGMRTDL